MNHNDSNECVAEISSLFPQADLQDKELELFRDTLLKFDRDDAIDAIRTHRLKNDFNRPKFNAILADLYERQRKNPTHKAPRRNRCIDTLRAQFVARDAGAQRWTDAEVALRVGYGWAMRYPGKGYAAKIQKDVKDLLRCECGMDETTAETYAASVFLPGPDFEDYVADINRRAA